MAKINLTPYKRVDSMELTDAQSIRRIESYLYTLNEQLRYELTHIDEDNMSSNDQASVGGVSNAAIRNVVQEEMENQVIDISQNETIIQINRRIDNLQKIQRSDEDAINQIRTALNQKASQATVDLLSSSLSSLSGTVSTISGNLSTVSGNLNTLSSAYSTHKHSLSVSGGTISIGGPTQSASSFNIADTQFYRDGVSAARPHSLSGITLGSGDTGSSVSKTVTVFCNDDEEIDLTTTINASAVYTAGSTAGYTNGWNAARGRVITPAAGTNATMTVGIPASTVDQSSGFDFTVSADNSYAYIKNALNTVVARVSNPAYNAGWAAAAAKFRRVGNYVYGPSSTVGGESSYHASIGGSHSYSASSFVHGGTTESSSWSGNINGVSVEYTKSSHTSALSIDWS